MADASTYNRGWTRERLLAAGAAIVVQALLGYALISGLAVHFPRALEDGLKLFTSVPPPPPPPPRIVPPPRTTASRPEGRASAPNLRSRAAPVAAPEPIVIVPPPPPPVVAAPKPYVANDFMSGSAPVRGPGTGAGGEGDGFGSGGAGDGDGGGGDGGADTAPRFVRGRMSTSDLPEALFVTGFDGTVGVRYLVATDGRVPECIVTRSSGNAAVDTTTCRLIRERFRFRPSRDGRGRPVNAWIVENHRWEVEADTTEVVETTRRRRARLW
jgi:protein TonB